MLTSQFENLYKKLNPEQKEAVDTIEGPVMVVAGPGTGKTQILTLRIANILLNTQINPENILALTFSESASYQMRSRLSDIIGTPAFRVSISTFHAFGNSIIQNYPEEFDHLLSSESITQEQQIELVEKLILESDLKLLRPWGEPFFYTKDILSAINDLKKESITPEKLKKVLVKKRRDFESIADLYHEKGKYKGQMKGKYQDEKKGMEKLEEFIGVYENYQEALLKTKKYDFNDMLIEVIKALEKNERSSSSSHSLLLQLQEKYQYILVDEHQDTNSSQNRLVELVASFYEIPNLFVVGDEKQAIYRFQGASLENFLYFKKKYPSAKLINLTQNYRSHQIILDASTSFISNNISANILTKVRLMSAKPETPEQIKLAILEDYYGEFEFISRKIRALLESGIAPKEIAVLSRRNFDLSEISYFLKRSGIDYVIDADMDVLSDLWVSKFLMVLEAINDFGSEEKMARAIQIDVFNFDPIDVFKILNYAKKEGLGIFDIFENLNTKSAKEIGLRNFKALKNFYSMFKGWVSLNDNIPFDDLLIKVFNESGIKGAILKSPERQEVVNKFITLQEDIKSKIFKDPKFNLEQFLKRVELLKKHHLSLEAKSKNNYENGIRLLTAHKAKGLEFDYVFIIQCFDGRWGNARKIAKKIKIPWEYFGGSVKTQAQFDEIEDERRLFYVGLTRARHDVILTYSKFSAEGKEQLPSQFLGEIKQELIQEIDTEDFNSQFEKEKEMLLDEPTVSLNEDLEFDYLRNLFLEKGLSITGFENFLTCPWKYFFVNLIALPDVKNKFQIFGTAIHSALDGLIKRRKIEADGKAYLLKTFEKSLKSQSLVALDIKEFMEKGEKALTGFYDKVFINFPDSIQSELTVRGVKFSENIILNGRIDMIEEVKKGQFRIHDFKTGKPKRRTEIDGSKEGKYNYLRQLVFYKLILDKYRNGFFKVKEGVVDFVEPDEKGSFTSYVFDLTKEMESQFISELESVGNQIYTLSFWDSLCGEKDCEWCALRKMMG